MQWQKGRVSKDSEKFRWQRGHYAPHEQPLMLASVKPVLEAAAIYKRLALEDEILKGERQRSGPRKIEQLLPQASLRSDDIPNSV